VATDSTPPVAPGAAPQSTGGPKPSFFTTHSVAISMLIALLSPIVTFFIAYHALNYSKFTDDLDAFDAKMANLVEQMNRKGVEDFEEKCLSDGYKYDGVYCLFEINDKKGTRIRRDPYNPLNWVSRSKK
jgi:hypothetical protein